MSNERMSEFPALPSSAVNQQDRPKVLLKSRSSLAVLSISKLGLAVLLKSRSSLAMLQNIRLGLAVLQKSRLSLAVLPISRLGLAVLLKSRQAGLSCAPTCKEHVELSSAVNRQAGPSRSANQQAGPSFAANQQTGPSRAKFGWD